MTETEFLQHSDALFTHLADEIDAKSDLDSEINGNVLTIENDDGAQVIVNRHAAKQEVWLAAKSGGYHFAWRDGQWHSSRENENFFVILNQALSQLAGETVEVEAM